MILDQVVAKCSLRLVSVIPLPSVQIAPCRCGNRILAIAILGFYGAEE